MKEQKETQQLNSLLPTPKEKDLEALNEEEILTEQEIKQILDKYRALKRAELNTIAYNRKLRQEEAEIAVSAEKFYNWIIEKAKSSSPEDGGVRGFELSEREKELYMMLSMYFTKDIRFTEYKDPNGENYSLHKGLWLYGGWGAGKTTIAELFSHNPLASYVVLSCENIANIYREKGTIGTYENLESICFDDLGKDMRDGAIPMHMGTKKNVMAYIISILYKANKKKEFRVHVTTNETAEQVYNLYGGDVAGRLGEMMNIISLDGIKSKR
jgi:hypothetical protein